MKRATAPSLGASNRRFQQTQGNPLNYNPDRNVNSFNTLHNHVFFGSLPCCCRLADRQRATAPATTKAQSDAVAAGYDPDPNSRAPRAIADLIVASASPFASLIQTFALVTGAPRLMPPDSLAAHVARVAHLDADLLGRLLRIEEELGDQAIYAGQSILRGRR